MYIFLLIILASAVIGMLVVLVRHFPQMANLDAVNLPEEQESRRKKSMIARRVNAEGDKLFINFFKKTEPLRKIWGRQQLRFRIYFGRIERLWHHEQQTKVLSELSAIPTEQVENKLLTLVTEGENSLAQNNLEAAEERFIAAIKLDGKYAPAYRGLGDTYLEKGELAEAEETYRFLIQIAPKDEMAKVKMSELMEKKGNVEEAITYLQQALVLNDSIASRFYHLSELLLKVYQPKVAREAIVQAVELEPRNPKYLDLMIETGILCVDKDLANRGFQELRLVNPENQKLDEFKVRINELG